MVGEPIPKRLFRGYSSTGKINPKTELFDIDLVKQDLLNHFHTSKGERVMRPEFGSLIWDLLFEPFDSATKDAIIADVESVIAFEPRVELTTLDVIEFEHGIRLNVGLFYTPLNVSGDLSIEFDRRNRTSGSSDIIESF